MKRILIIHPEGNIHNNPNLLGIVNILCEKGYFVDVFSIKRDEIFQGNVCQNSEHFLFQNKHEIPISEGYVSILSLDEINDTTMLDLFTTKFRSYDLVIGVDRGVIEASIISKIQNIPLGLISYELFFADETSYEFKKDEIDACTNLSFAVCQDILRSKKLSEENQIDIEKIINIPVLNRGFNKQAKTYYLYDKLNIPVSKKIAIYIGSLSIWGGIDYLIESTKYWSDEWVLILHSRYNEPSIVEKIKEFASDKIYLSEEAIDSVDDMNIVLSSVDLGITLYKPTYDNMYTGKNLEYIGLASGKTFTYLKHCIPVCINEIGEMSEIIKNNNMGCVINLNEPLVIKIPELDLERMKENIEAVYPYNFDLNVLIDPLLDKIRKLCKVNESSAVSSKDRVVESVSIVNNSQNTIKEEQLNPAIGAEYMFVNKQINERGNQMESNEIENAIESGDYTKAIELLREVIEREPGNTDALNNLAVILLMLGDNKAAVRALNLVLKVDPENEIAEENLKTISI